MIPAEQERMRESGELRDPCEWVDAYGGELFRYAVSRVGEVAVAEDLVQECFLAALQGRGKFQGRSAERTWLIGILRHKIFDHLRSSGKHSAADLEEVEGASLDQWFDSKGRWRRRPEAWSVDASEAAESREFWEVFYQCLGGLSARLREAFTRRVVDGEETASICKEMEISATNFWVILHRSRMMLRACLVMHWFAGASSPKGRAVVKL